MHYLTTKYIDPSSSSVNAKEAKRDQSLFLVNGNIKTRASIMDNAIVDMLVPCSSFLSISSIANSTVASIH